MNLYESIKSNHNRKVPRRFIKESAEGGKEFWDKVDAGEIKVGGTLDSDGAGDIDVLDLNKNADYILIKRNSGYQPFVAAWAPEFYNGKLTWGQGHYFDNEEDAREYFNQKAVKECDKPIKEAIDMDKLRAARGRENQQTLDKESKIKDNIHNNAMEVIDVLNNYGYDNLLEVGNYLLGEGLLNQDLDNKNKLTADGWSHRFGYLSGRNEYKHITAFAIMGGGACGNVGIKFTNTRYFLMDEKCENIRYNTVDEIPSELLSYYEYLADWANNGNGSVDNFINKVEAFVNAYSEKYPELQESCKGKKEIKETGSKEGAAKRKINRRKKNLEWLKSQVDKKPMSDLSDEDKKVITKNIDKALSTYKESNLAKYLGVKSVLDEAINHANDDINAKIKEALRSKTAARKYKKDLEDEGIKIDDTPREGVNLIGPNGRVLSADRQNIYGPTKPGHGRTHDDGRYGNSIQSKHKDLDSYDSYIARDKENLDKLEKMQRDDIIRAYPNKTSEEAIEAHKKEIENGMTSLARDKKWRKNIEDDIHELRQARDKAHRGTIVPGYSDTTIDREKYYKDPKNKDGRGYSKLVDAIDYKGYLDSKDNNENKDFANGHYRQTPGQKLRNEFKSLKQTADSTYWGSYDAKRDLADKEIDAQAIENRKKEIEEEYKKKMDDEVNSMLERKSNADASYKGHKDSYRARINAIKDFRAKHGMAAKDDPDFETYINKKAGRS